MATMAIRMRTTDHLKRIDERLDRFEANVDRRFEQVDKRFDQVDERFQQVDKRFEQVDKRFEQVDERFVQVDTRFEQVDKRFERVDTRFDDMRSHYDALAEASRADFKNLYDLIQAQGEKSDSRFNQLQIDLRTMGNDLRAAFTGRLDSHERRIAALESAVRKTRRRRPG